VAAGSSAERAALYQAVFTAPGMNAARMRPLVTELGSLEAALGAPRARLAELLGVVPAKAGELQAAVVRALPAATAQVRAALSAGLGVVTWEDPDYPQALHDDPVGCAPILYVEGALPPQLAYPSHQVRAFAVIGTRRATPGGLGFARDVGRGLSREGVLVVSGLAIGIDGAAHTGALEASELDRLGSAAAPTYGWRPGVAPTPRPAGTIAVLGGGHGHVHPAMHLALARRIVAAGGAVLSEWAPDVQPRPYRFLQRNRVISGLSRGVLVVEAGVRSGTNSTVAHALDQGRDIMAVPASPWTRSGASCLAMIQEGAQFAFDHTDVLAKFPELGPTSQPPKGEEAADGPRAETRSAQSELRSGAEEVALPAATSRSELDPVTEEVTRHLTAGVETSLDALVTATARPPHVLIGALATLELMGVVEATPGGRFRLRGG